MASIDLKSVYTTGTTYTVLELLKKLIDKIDGYQFPDYVMHTLDFNSEFGELWQWEDIVVRVFNFIKDANVVCCKITSLADDITGIEAIMCSTDSDEIILGVSGFTLDSKQALDDFLAQYHLVLISYGVS